MKKSIRNVDVVAHKLQPALIRVRNHTLEAVRKAARKREEMVENRKTKVIVVKWYRASGEFCLSSEKED